MKYFIYTLFVTFFLISASSAEELVPVLNSQPAFENEEINLEPEESLGYRLKARHVETYRLEEEEEEEEKPGPLFKKGRLSLDAGVSSKRDTYNTKVGDKVLFEPNLKVTDEFSLLFVNKIDPRDIQSNSQEIGLKYSPKKIKGSSFSVIGSGDETKQKVKFSTDFYLW